MLNLAAMRERQLGRLKRRVRDTAVRGALAALGILFLGLAMVFVLVAAHTWLSARWGTIVSAIVLAAALVIIGLVFLLLASRPLREAATEPPHAGAELTRGLGDAAAPAHATGLAASPLQNPTLQAAGMGLIAGILLGRRRPRRRRSK